MPSGLPEPTNLKEQRELLDSLADNKTLVKLVGLVPGLLDTILKEAGKITILAPNEMAFGALPQVLVAFLTDPKNVEVLSQVLRYHVIFNNGNLLGEPYPPSIQIDQVLVPPSLQGAVDNIVNSARQSMGHGGRVRLHSLPFWLSHKNPANNRA